MITSHRQINYRLATAARLPSDSSNTIVPPGCLAVFPFLEPLVPRDVLVLENNGPQARLVAEAMYRLM